MWCGAVLGCVGCPVAHRHRRTVRCARVLRASRRAIRTIRDATTPGRRTHKAPIQPSKAYQSNTKAPTMSFSVSCDYSPPRGMLAHVLSPRVRYASTCPISARFVGLRNLLLDSAPSAPRAHPRAVPSTTSFDFLTVETLSVTPVKTWTNVRPWSPGWVLVRAEYVSGVSEPDAITVGAPR